VEVEREMSQPKMTNELNELNELNRQAVISPNSEGRSSFKNRYIELWQTVKREGIPELLAWLETTDFYTAPCSTKYHLSREGGLLEHSLNVFDSLLAKGFDLESTTICALSHDFCKIGFYTTELRWRKDKDNKWEQYPVYVVKDQFPFGHGEKSALLVNRFIKLKPSEHMAIRWHMGGFTPGIQDYSLSQAMGEAFRAYPLAVYLHMADMGACYLLEKEEEA